MPFMPIFIKVSNWHQTPTNITIRIPSFGIVKEKVDILTSEKYIKAHYSQYIFEIFLWKPIDIRKSTCVVTDKEIIFELVKSLEEDWDKLEADLDKSSKIDLRRQVIEDIQKRSKEEAELKVNKNAELKRTAVREQIAIDTQTHDWIANIKKSEKEKALKELNLWEDNKSNSESLVIKDITTKKNEFKKSSDCSKHKSSTKIKTKPVIITEGIKDEPTIPMPRKCQTINVTFTKRDFPTPSRESRTEEEQEWLAKQAAARRSAGFDSKDLRPEERNPQWLKAKGDEFFQAKNYLGALSAYSEGIRISKEYVDLYINRSAAHLAVGNYQKTMEDCSTALEIMTPPIPATLEMRVKCIARRGVALYKIGFGKQGINELETAVKMLPNNSPLKEDIERMKHEINTSKDN